MKFSKLFIVKSSIFSVVVMSLSTNVYATGALVTFGRASAIPTLSTSMLMVLSLLLFVVAFKIAKQKNNRAGKIFSTFLGIAALLAIGTNNNLIKDLQAGGGGSLFQLQEVNPPIRIEPGPGIDFENITNLRINIESIAVDVGSQCMFVFPEDSCVPANIMGPFTGTLSNLIIPSGDLCAITCGPIVPILARPADGSALERVRPERVRK